MTQKAKSGDSVSIHFTATLDDGTPVLSTRQSGLFTFEIGDGTTFPKINDITIGMGIGEKKTITLQPADAFGDINSQLIIEVPKDQLPQDIKEGNWLVNPDNEAQQFLIKEIKGDKVIIDGNHPLAGKALTFDLEIIDIKARLDN